MNLFALGGPLSPVDSQSYTFGLALPGKAMTTFKSSAVCHSFFAKGWTAVGQCLQRLRCEDLDSAMTLVKLACVTHSYKTDGI